MDSKEKEHGYSNKIIGSCWLQNRRLVSLLQGEGVDVREVGLKACQFRLL